MKWFRFYSEVAHDPKVQKLTPGTFKFWVNCLCVANDQKIRGSLPTTEDLAFVLRLSIEATEIFIAELMTAGLLDRCENGSLAPHKWHERQMLKDSSASRVKRYRDKMRSNGEVVGAYVKHRAFVLERDGSKCVYCLSTAKLVLDHLIPVSRGGDGEPDNLVTACKLCNSGKSGRLVEDTGYRFANPSTSKQYEDVKTRLKTSVTVTVTPCHGDSNTLSQNLSPLCHGDSNTLEEIRREKKERENSPAPVVPFGHPIPTVANDPAEVRRVIERVAEMFGSDTNIPQTAQALCHDTIAAWVLDAAESMFDSKKSDPRYLRGIVKRMKLEGGPKAPTPHANGRPTPEPPLTAAYMPFVNPNPARRKPTP